MTSIEAMKIRKSVRTFSDMKIGKSLLSKIEKVLKDAEENLPMGTKVEFGYIPLDKSNRSESGAKIGTYGFVKNQKGYVYGVCQNSENGFLDFSYGFQRIIIELTKLGLGTVWLGGTFNKKELFKHVSVNDGEVIPSITAVGFSAEKKRFTEKLISKLAGSKNRKDWGELFFKKDFTTPLEKNEALDLSTAFDMVRIGPSANNWQTWRLIKDNNNIHFFNSLSKNSYNNENMNSMMLMNIGVAMFQFEESIKELGFNGEFTQEQPKIDTPTPYNTYHMTYRLK